MNFKFGFRSALIFAVLLSGVLCQDQNGGKVDPTKVSLGKSTNIPSDNADSSTKTEPDTTLAPSTQPDTTVTPPTENPTEEPVTTPAPAPPKPSPSGFNYFNVSSSDGTICTMFLGDFVFTVTYNVGGKNVNETKVYAPKLAGPDVRVTGSCKSKHQWIKVKWGESFKESSLRLNFTSEKNVWKMAGIKSELYMDNNTFPNATKSGNVITSTFNVSIHDVGAQVNQSYKCFAEVFLNGTSQMNGEVYMYPLQLSMKDVQVQAYNQIKNKQEFVDALHCDADRIADIVPIAVGCALAGLVLIVVIAYFIGRRRRTQVYQSV